MFFAIHDAHPDHFGSCCSLSWAIWLWTALVGCSIHSVWSDRLSWYQLVQSSSTHAAIHSARLARCSRLWLFCLSARLQQIASGYKKPVQHCIQGIGWRCPGGFYHQTFRITLSKMHPLSSGVPVDVSNARDCATSLLSSRFAVASSMCCATLSCRHR